MRAKISEIGAATLLSFAASLGSTILAFVFSETGPMVFLLGMYLTICVCLLDRTIQATHERDRALLEMLSAHNREIIAALERGPEVTRAASDIPHAYLRGLSEVYLKSTKKQFQAVVKPAREFQTEAQYFHAAEIEMNSLKSGDSVRLVCSDCDRRWTESRPLKRYLSANFGAAARGVDIIRLLPDRFAMIAEARNQTKRGVKVALIKEEVIQRLPAWQRLPEDAGIGIVNAKRVYFHYYQRDQFYGCVIESPFFASIVLSVFSELEPHGEPVEPAA